MMGHRTPIHTSTHAHTDTCACQRACATQTHTHACMHTHTHAHTHTHTHTHTHMRPPRGKPTLPPSSPHKHRQTHKERGGVGNRRPCRTIYTWRSTGFCNTFLPAPTLMVYFTPNDSHIWRGSQVRYSLPTVVQLLCQCLKRFDNLTILAMTESSASSAHREISQRISEHTFVAHFSKC
jgi:hypothetical protein